MNPHHQAFARLRADLPLFIGADLVAEAQCAAGRVSALSRKRRVETDRSELGISLLV